ncbi:MAG: O-antigen ligase family protein [Acetobacteraceae bacterium]
MSPAIAALDRHGSRAALVAALAFPFLLIHAPSAAEGVVAGLAVGLLLRMALLRDASALRAPWVVAALAFWAWGVVATVLAGGDPGRIGVALAWLRFPLAALALGVWVLAEARARRWMLFSVGAAVAWVVLEVWVQLAFGRSLSGRLPHEDGILTGPFGWARAGPYLALLLWPPLLAAAAWLAARRGALAAAAPAALALVTVFLTGQRLAALQVLAGLGAGALLLPALRRPALVAAVVGAAALAALPALAPDAFRRLVLELASGAPVRAYLDVFRDGAAAVAAAPWTGWGQDGFRAACTALGLGDCASHPHNVYLEAAVEAGLPGLALFLAFSLLAFAAVAPGLWQRGGPEGRGLLLSLVLAALAVGVLKSAASIHQAGPVALLVGWALAAARRPTSSA